ncbi:MAG: hypothetical protein VXW27_02155 [Pseudomonadota bacterium]|nr:hypothetical protein [Pseudomonadota bacterium]
MSDMKLMFAAGGYFGMVLEQAWSNAACDWNDAIITILGVFDQDEMSIKVEISIEKLQYFALAHTSLEGELDRKMEMRDAF